MAPKYLEYMTALFEDETKICHGHFSYSFYENEMRRQASELLLFCLTEVRNSWVSKDMTEEISIHFLSGYFS